MSIPDWMIEYSGRWAGPSRLWMMPGVAAHESESTLDVTAAVRGGYAALAYTWAEDGQPQQGLLVIAPPGEDGSVMASWIDTFHTAGGFMTLRGGQSAGQEVRVRASYPAPDGPDWGWQVRLAPAENGALRLSMDNITPDGQEYLAVEAIYTRRG